MLLIPTAILPESLIGQWKMPRARYPMSYSVKIGKNPTRLGTIIFHPSSRGRTDYKFSG